MWNNRLHLVFFDIFAYASYILLGFDFHCPFLTCCKTHNTRHLAVTEISNSTLSIIDPSALSSCDCCVSSGIVCSIKLQYLTKSYFTITSRFCFIFVFIAELFSDICRRVLSGRSYIFHFEPNSNYSNTCGSIAGCQRFRGTCCIYRHDRQEVVCGIFLQNVYTYLHVIRSQNTIMMSISVVCETTLRLFILWRII